MADTSVILALPSFQSLWLFPMSIASFSPNCGARSWASQVLVRPSSHRLLMNAPKASCMTCAMHGMWFLKAGHCIAESSSVDWNSHVIEQFEEALSVLIPSEQPSVSSIRSSTSFKCTVSFAPVWWPFHYQPWVAFKMGLEQAINFINHKLNFTLCPVSIHIVSTDRHYG